MYRDDGGADEYFLPLVDESRASYDDDQSQGSYMSGDERSSPIPPLHRSQSSPIPPHAMTANPQSPGDEQQDPRQYQYSSQNHREQRRNSNDSRPSSPEPNSYLPLRSRLVFTAHKRKSTFSFAVTSFCLLGFLLYGNARSSLRVTVKEVDDLVIFSEKLHRKLRRADHDMRLLERELTELDAYEARLEDERTEYRILDQSSAFANAELNEKMRIQKEKVLERKSMADHLKSQVIQISKQDAIDKYGDGNIRIKMDLIFPPKKSEDGTVLPDTGPHTIIMEMAPLGLMPHSVYTFLEMVSEGLLDGCSFIINAEHILKAAPLPYDQTSPSIKAKQFSDAGLESVAFKEYSPSFPHKKYTVGFAADGSPSFYINSEDNSEIHVGDPCFAEVVSGFDTVQRLDEEPIRNEIWFDQRIGIKEVHIL
jgi:cyclophilin family peptidyl-prolyl cis-trans isomerase